METEKDTDIIHLLPDSVANQIAAGEVIQRPASVIKELVENSVDAGAKNIEIVVKDAGKSLIQVVDDGKGMSPTDARMAFERHATSKIRCADDLFTLHTMGFRGEALPSIAAVSELEALSRRDCDELGTKIVIRASHVDSQEPAMSLKGTNIKVKNLFYNFVARRRFLKKDSVEMSHIIHEFERLALVNTDVAFKLTSNGVVIHSLPVAPLKNRIGALFGKTIAENLIPVKTETSLVKIEGYISLPAGARQRGQRQFLFVNGRNMRHPYFHKAILSCYDNLIAKDSQPHYFINFIVPPDRIDVNIHPQKHEIKFEDEQSVWQILTAAIRESLGRYNATSTLEFNSTGAPEIPTLIEGNLPPADLKELTDGNFGSYNPFELHTEQPITRQSKFDFENESISRKSSLTQGRPSAMNNIQTGLTGREQSVNGWQNFFEAAKSQLPDIHDESTPSLIQLRDKYIVTESSEGILIIDQHRAHVNVLFDALSKDAKSGEVSSQTLMFPETLELDASERIMLDSSIEMLERNGFRIGFNADGSLSLEGAPESLGSKNPPTVLQNILRDLIESGADAEEEAMNRMLLVLARSAAITAGQRLTSTELQHLVASLMKLTSPGYTPDGLTVIYRLSDERLLSFFNK